MSNPNPSNKFQKGDPRINRNGRPKTFDAFRELALAIAHEEAKRGKGENQETIVINGHKATIAETILRQWAASNNPQLQRAFIEYAFGKVPEQHELTGKDGGAIAIQRVEVILPPEDNNDSAG